MSARSAGRALPGFPLLGDILRFFDEHVRGVDTRLADEAPVHFHTMRAERWQSAASWPPAPADATLFLWTGEMLAHEPGKPAAVAYRADYCRGTRLNTRYGRLQIRNVEAYHSDWEQTSAGHLAFRSAPFEDDLTVAGHPLPSLELACDQPDACIFAYLEDIRPDGSRRYVTEGMLRALHHNGTEASGTYRASWPLPSFRRADAAPLAPGEPARIEIPLLPTSWTFPAGHHVGLRLAGADRDNFVLWPYGRTGNWRIGTGPGGSRLTLPVL